MDRCLLQVHAHPDDEASKGAGVAARYTAEGVRCVLVTCTGGEAGDILNEAMDTPEVRQNLAEVRMQELKESVAILGYAGLHLLGYRDSGRPETEENAHPDAFANAPLEEAVGKLVAIIRTERPQVIITYPEVQTFYPHPDHIRVTEVTLGAWEAAGDADRYPDAGDPWTSSKLYAAGFTKRRIQAAHDWLITHDKESPYQQWLSPGSEREWRDDLLRTQIDVRAHVLTARESLRAHRTQVAPDSFWFSVPDEVAADVYPYEDYHLIRTRVEGTVPDEGFERDLFAGI